MNNQSNRSGFVLFELIIYLMILSLLLSIMVPKLDERYTESMLLTLSESFVADYYYGMNLSLIEYKTIYIKFYKNDYCYTISDISGTIYKTVNYDSTLLIDEQFDYHRIMFVNGKPLADDCITFKGGSQEITFTILKSGYLYETSK